MEHRGPPSVGNESSAESSAELSAESSSAESSAEEFPDTDDSDFGDDDWLVHSSSDDGYDSAANASEPEEICVARRYPEPQPPPPLAIPLPLEGADGLIAVPVNVNRRPRVMPEDRHHPYVSRGYDDEGAGYSLRKALRCSEIQDGRGSFNGFEYNLVPKRITGLAIKKQQLFYFVEWNGGARNRSFAIEAGVMSVHSPSMVLRFHQQMALNPCAYKKL